MKAMTRNGSITAHGREWPLYERKECGVITLLMRDEDRIEKEWLDENVITFPWQ